MWLKNFKFSYFMQEFGVAYKIIILGFNSNFDIFFKILLTQTKHQNIFHRIDTINRPNNEKYKTLS